MPLVRIKLVKSDWLLLDTMIKSGLTRRTRSGSAATSGWNFVTSSSTFEMPFKYALSLTAITRSGGTIEYRYSSIDQYCEAMRSGLCGMRTRNPSASMASRG